MIRPSTIVRLAKLSRWQPPAGVIRRLMVCDDGMLIVYLSAGGYLDTVGIEPGVRLGRSVFHGLNRIARDLTTFAQADGDRKRAGQERARAAVAAWRRCRARLKAAEERFLGAMERVATGMGGR